MHAALVVVARAGRHRTDTLTPPLARGWHCQANHGLRAVHGVENFFPNTIVDSLLTAPWQALHDTVGRWHTW